MNTGDYNTGNFNTGDGNTGQCNTGHGNAGRGNTGDRNTGYWNTGSCNTGDHNNGHRNTGNNNTGDHNAGDWNTCSYSAGYFNTTEQKIPVFNGAAWVDRIAFLNSVAYQALSSVELILTEWVPESDCTKLERALSNYIKGEGVLISRTFKEACSLWWSQMKDENKDLLQTMVGFDADIFHEITGIDVRGKSPDIQTLKQENQTLKNEVQALLERIAKLESE